jgi:very-short-patch-repair endonuclease
MSYDKLSEKQKKEMILKEYSKNGKSFSLIAKEYKTYPNKVRRDAKKFGIQSRSRSDAAITALEKGRATPPMKGKKHLEDTKLKISQSQGEVWDSLGAKEREKRSEIGKASWEQKTDSQKKTLVQKGAEAVRLAARVGSKLEKYLLEGLTHKGFKVQFHKEHLLRNQRLEIDLFVDDCRTAIEVDGPSHFKPVWGHKNLERNKKSDKQKTGLILSQGFALIRIKQDKRTSQRYFREILNRVISELSKISKEFPKESKRYIEI